MLARLPPIAARRAVRQCVVQNLFGKGREWCYCRCLALQGGQDDFCHCHSIASSGSLALPSFTSWTGWRTAVSWFVPEEIEAVLGDEHCRLNKGHQCFKWYLRSSGIERSSQEWWLLMVPCMLIRTYLSHPSKIFFWSLYTIVTRRQGDTIACSSNFCRLHCSLWVPWSRR